MHKVLELLEKYCERVEKELEDLYKKIDKVDTISPADVNTMDTLLHSLKSIKTVYAMVESKLREEEEYDGYSGRRFYASYGRGGGQSGENYSGRGGQSGNRYPMMQDTNYSGRRDSRGRYSRDSEKDDAMMCLENMMNRTRSDSEANAIREAMDALRNS